MSNNQLTNQLIHQFTNVIINKFTNSPINSQNAPLHLSRELYKSTLFMQNEPNFKNARIYISAYNTSGYINFQLISRPKNEPKRTQNEPNFSSKLALFSQFWLCNSSIFQIENKVLFGKRAGRIPAYRTFLGGLIYELR